MMIYRNRFLVTLFTCFCFILFNTGIINSANAEQAKTGPAQTTSGTIYGKVTEIINAAGYTYAEVDTGEKKVWAAGPVTPLKNGDMVAFSTRMPMENFHSKSLERDFSILYFVDRFTSDKDAPPSNFAATATRLDQNKPQQASKVIQTIKKVEGGNTIDEIYADKNTLNGKTVRVRGQVTKFTPNIMGKNWLHIKDGSSNDLTITSTDEAAIDDVVIIEGKLGLNKDFGYGYVYPLIVEDAGIKQE